MSFRFSSGLWLDIPLALRLAEGQVGSEDHSRVLGQVSVVS
jgi:hypothetical protein